MRHSGRNRLLLALCKAAVQELAACMASGLPRAEEATFPQVAAALPPECTEALALARAASFTDDKLSLSFNWFLSRNQ
eukprot:4889505-Lingulodinium_polyedra.AAC.1